MTLIVVASVLFIALIVGAVLEGLPHRHWAGCSNPFLPYAAAVFGTRGQAGADAARCLSPQSSAPAEPSYMSTNALQCASAVGPSKHVIVSTDSAGIRPNDPVAVLSTMMP